LEVSTRLALGRETIDRNGIDATIIGRANLINQYALAFFRGILREFAGMSSAGLAGGTSQFGDRVDYSFVLHKDCNTE
jgi:hypothetical protein